MLKCAVAIIGVACSSACSVDYLDAETDGSGGSPGSCSVVAEDYTGDESGISDWVIGKYEGNYWMALRFKASADAVACGASVKVHATGPSVPGTLRVSIRDEVAGPPDVPGVAIGPASANVDGESIPEAPTLLKFSGLLASLEKDKSYYVVLEKQGNDEANHVVIHHSNAIFFEGQGQSSEDGVTWGLNGYEQGLLQIFR